MPDYPVSHTFDNGLNTDAPLTRTPATVATALHNMHLLADGDEGEQLIAQSSRGNYYVAGLPVGWVVLGSEQFGGVRYFALGELAEDGKLTGRGQLGSFPSPQPAAVAGQPNPTSGRLLNRYRPLQNFDDGSGSGYGDFISPNFNFRLDRPVQIETQADYDGTVNLILNDAHNPPRLFNTRFRVNENATFDVVDREGERDANLYTPASFSDTALLFQRSRSLVRMEFTQLLDGGQVAGGHWQYYGCYVNQDTQASDVVAWSPLIPVFDGDNVTNIRGTTGNTQRRVRLLITGLDAAYQFFRIIAVHTAGEGAAEAISCVQLEPDQRLSGPTLTFTHTGYEKTLPYDVATLSVRTQRINRFAGMTQVANMLAFIGGREGTYDDALLRDFSRQVQLGWNEYDIPLVGARQDGNTSGLGEQALSAGFTAGTADGDGQQGGYANPWNGAYRVGYGSGECYPFGIVYRLIDGSDSHVFPVRGHDHLLSNAAFEEAAGTYDARGWSVLGENEDGVYRFPLNTHSQRQGSISLDGRYARVMGVTFRLPDVPAELLGQTVGCYFVRAPRNPDRLCQGYSVPVLNSLQRPPNGNEPFDHHNAALKPIFDNNSTRTGSNLKCIPAVRGILEMAVKKWDRTENQGRTIGAFPFQFSFKMDNNGANQYLINPWRLAFYSPDTAANPAAYRTALAGGSLRMSHQGRVQGHGVEYGWRNYNGQGGSFAEWKTTSVVAEHTVGEKRVLSHWTEQGTEGTNDGKFASAEFFLVGKHNPANTDDRYLTQAVFEEYVGLELQGTDKFTDAQINQLVDYIMNQRGTGQEIASFIQSAATVSSTKTFAWLMNLYPQRVSNDALAAQTQGARPTDVLKDLYSIDSQGYYPISPLYRWDELETMLDNNRRITVFGGDTYVASTFKRLSRGVFPPQRREDRYDEAPICTILAMVCESTVHPYASRIPEKQARPGENAPRSFFPATLQLAGLDWNTVRGNLVKAPETSGFNAGMARHDGHTDQLTLPRNLPYREVEFPNQIAVTGTHIAGSFQNGYRRFLPGTARTYERELGAMTGVRALGRTLVVGHEKGVILVEVNERTQAGANGGGPVFLEIQNILSPTATVVSRKIGLLSQQALLATDQTVYGLASEGFWWLEGNQLKLGSALHVDRVLLPRLRQLGRGRGTQLLQHEARLSYDASLGDVVVSVFNNVFAADQPTVVAMADPYYLQPVIQVFPDEPVPVPVPATAVQQYPYDPAGCVQLLYSERKACWISTVGWNGQHAFSIGDTFYSVPMPNNGRRTRPGIYRHQGHYGYYYDYPQESFVEFVVLGQGPRTQKILNNLMLVSNEVLPVRLEVTIEDGTTFTQQLSTQGGIARRNMELRENEVYLTVQHAAHEARQRGKALRVRLYYQPNTRVLLESVVATVTDSYN